MKKFVIGTISGILNQLLSLKQTIIGRECFLESDYLDLNSWFWSEPLKTEQLSDCLIFIKTKNIKVPIKLQ